MPDAAPVPIHLDAVIDGLVENPALPAEMIRRLIACRRGFGKLAMRSDLTGDLIAEIVATDYHWLLHSLALNRNLPQAVRLGLANHRDPAVRAALVSRDQHTSEDPFERWINDPDKHAREWLAKGDTVPDEFRARLAHDADPQVRSTLARWWPQAPEDVRRILLTDPVDTVRAAACSTYYARLPHPVPPTDLIPRLLEDPVTRSGVVRHLAATAETANRLATDPDDDVRRELAAHPQLPPDLRARLAEDPSARVRVAIFARPDTPDPTRRTIYSDVMNTSSSLIDMLDKDLDDELVLRRLTDHMAVAELRTLKVAWVTSDPLPYVTSPYVCFRRSAACSPSLPPEVVAQLLNDQESIVRTTMARHAPHLVDLSTAEYIDRHFKPEKKTNWRPADEYTFPPETLRRFATDPDPRMRSLAPRDPNLPTDIARHLAADRDAAVRHAIATHPRLPVHALLTLLADPSEWVSKAAAASPTLPVADMDRILRLAGL